MHKLISLIILLTIFLSGCKTSSEPVPPEKKPPGYQEDIPWPSLADSPWPMYGADPQNTFRSKTNSPLTGEFDWVFETFDNEYSVVLGPDSTIYLVMGQSGSSTILALDLNGSLKWETFLDKSGALSTPTVLADGSVLAATIDKFYILSPVGKISKSFVNPGARFWPNIKINVSYDGNIIYIRDFKIIESMSLEGTINWSFQNENIPFLSKFTAFSPDGNTLYLGGSGLIAFDLNNQEIKWQTDNSFGNSEIMVDSHGKVYSLQDTNTSHISVSRFSAEGDLEWKYNFIGTEGMTLDKNGNIYLGSPLISLDYNGKLRWSTNIYTDGMLSNNGLELYISRGDLDRNITLYAINMETGNIDWQTKQENTNYEPSTAGVIGYNKIFCPGWGNSNLITFK